MAVNYSRTGSPVSRKRQNDWDGFLLDVRRCGKCGRLSLLNDRCPDCGSPMKNNQIHNILRHLAVFILLLLTLVPVLIAIHMRISELAIGWRFLVIPICIVLHGFGFLFLYSTISGTGTLMRLVPPGRLFRLSKSTPTVQNMARHMDFLPRLRNAYYLDIAWLERAEAQLQEGDWQGSRKLLGQAVWLSAITDNPRLAKLRFRLLCHGSICEGDDTDLDAIMDQLRTLSDSDWDMLLCRPGGLQTLCDALRFDPMDLKEENQQRCLYLLLSCLENQAFLGLEIPPRLTERIIRTLAYCGPESCDNEIKLLIFRLGIMEDLIRYEPDFRKLTHNPK